MTGVIATIPKFQFSNATGTPLANGTLTIYLAGTTTLTNTWQDYALTSLNTNPVVLDSRGECVLWLDSAVTYKFVLKNSSGVVQWTQDNLSGSGAASAALSTALAASSGSSLVGFLQSGTGAVARTSQAKMREIVSALDFGATGDGVTDDTAKLQACINSAPAVVDLVGKTYRITAKLLFSIASMNIKNGTLKFDGPITDRLANVTASNVTFDTVIFDGNSKQPRSGLVYVDTSIDRPKFINCIFKSLTCVNNGSNVLNATYALLVSPYAVTNLLVDNCQFKDFIKYNDGVNGTPIVAATIGLGFIGGICFLPEDVSPPIAVQPTPTSGIVQGCTFDNIQTIIPTGSTTTDQSNFDDADAIRTFGQAGGATTINMLVSNNTFRKCSKRAGKFLAAETIAIGNVVYATGMTYGMVNPFFLGNNCALHNTKVYSSSALPVLSTVQWFASLMVPMRETIIDGFFVSHCINGFQFSAESTSTTLSGLTVRNLNINQVSAFGISQGSPIPSTQSLVKFENIKILASGNSAVGIRSIGATDGTAGCSFNNIDLNNCGVDISGVNNDLDGLRITIDSTAYVGESTSSRMVRFGSAGAGGYQNVKNVFINAFNLNTAFLNATRTEMILFTGDNANYNNIRLKVPDALTQNYQHCEFIGTSWDLTSYTYDGPGYTYIGQSLASTRWAVKGAVRLGSGASASFFLYTNNAGTGNGLFENITDFRPTTNSTITINNGLGVGNRFIVTNVATKSTNATIVQNGGLATVTNAIYFP